MSPGQDNDRLYCWEQVQRTNPLFRVSHPFAPGRQAGGLLALYALCSAVEELCAEWNDAEVARRKLEWWRAETLVTGFADSNHPILKELDRAGVAADRSALKELFDSAEARIDGRPPADGAALESLCLKTGRPPCALELGLSGQPVGAEMPEHLARRIGLAQLLRESTGQGRPNRLWWIPLNLLARHGLSRAELERRPDAAAARAVYGEILHLQQGWAQSSQALEPASRHLAVQAHLQTRALARLEKRPPSDYAEALRKIDAGMLFRAWTMARRVNRP